MEINENVQTLFNSSAARHLMDSDNNCLCRKVVYFGPEFDMVIFNNFTLYPESDMPRQPSCYRVSHSRCSFNSNIVCGENMTCEIRGYSTLSVFRNVYPIRQRFTIIRHVDILYRNRYILCRWIWQAHNIYILNLH